MKTRIITVCLLFLQLLFAGCSKEEAIDNVDPDVPDVEISEEEMEIAIQNLERVDQKMQPLFQASESLDDLAQHLDEIKAMEGVEDAWVGDGANSLWIKIKEGGRVAYLYPGEDYMSEISSSILQLQTKLKKNITKAAGIQTLENKKFCIINQLSNSLADDFSKNYDILIEYYREIYKAQFDIINCEDFTRYFLRKTMPQYDLIFMITHGEYDKGIHWLVTGERKNKNNESISKWKDNKELAFTHVKETRNNIFGMETEPYIEYLMVSEEYIKHIEDFKNPNSIFFNVACHSLEGSPSLWNILKEKELGCYLGFDNTNSIGVMSGVAFFESLPSWNTVSKTYNALPNVLKEEWRKETGLATLHCYPSDCQITLFGEPEVTDEEAVDLGLSVKWAKKNLGASNYTDKGNGYEDYKYMDIYYEDPILVGEDGEDVNLSGHSKYDYARKALGGNWRMPTSKEWQELKEKCTWKTVVIDDKPGFQITGPNGNSIFLPGEQYQQPVMGIQYYDGLYATGTLTHTGLRSFYIMGSIAPYGINVCRVEELGIADTAFIRPVCD